MNRILVSIFIALTFLDAQAQKYDISKANKDEFGCFYRADTSKKVIYLVFTAHDFTDGKDTIIQTLNRNKIKASFFFTGDFYRNYPQIVKELRKDKHYLGAHSNKHLLYCDWNKRDSLLVSDKELVEDLKSNYQEMSNLGIRKNKAKFFMPPFEWYNSHVVKLVKEEGITLVNFSPGTSSNADYTTPYMKNYRSSNEILGKIYQYEKEKPNGLNGFHLLIHFGTDPERMDKLYNNLDEIIKHLKERGYSFGKFR